MGHGIRHSSIKWYMGGCADLILRVLTWASTEQAPANASGHFNHLLQSTMGKGVGTGGFDQKMTFNRKEKYALSDM